MLHVKTIHSELKNVEWVRIVQGIDVDGILPVIMLRILSIPSPLPRTSLSLEEWSYRYIHIYRRIVSFRLCVRAVSVAKWK